MQVGANRSESGEKIIKQLDFKSRKYESFALFDNITYFGISCKLLWYLESYLSIFRNDFVWKQDYAFL